MLPAQRASTRAAAELAIRAQARHACATRRASCRAASECAQKWGRPNSVRRSTTPRDSARERNSILVPLPRACLDRYSRASMFARASDRGEEWEGANASVDHIRFPSRRGRSARSCGWMDRGALPRRRPFDRRLLAARWSVCEVGSRIRAGAASPDRDRDASAREDHPSEHHGFGRRELGMVFIERPPWTEDRIQDMVMKNLEAEGSSRRTRAGRRLGNAAAPRHDCRDLAQHGLRGARGRDAGRGGVGARERSDGHPHRVRLALAR